MNEEEKMNLLQYAKEDLEICKENGCMAICDTKIGLVQLQSARREIKLPHSVKINNVDSFARKFGTRFLAMNNKGELLTGWLSFSSMQKWLSEQYKIAEVVS